MIKQLKGKKIAIVSMGRSQLDYHMSISHSQEYDEVWAINSMCAVIKCDRVFMMDPASRFFDTFDAGPQTQVMRRILPRIDVPIYSCEKDNRVPAIELYPLKKVVKELGCGYLNNTIAYAIAFAALNKVGTLNMYGADFSYGTNIHFGEMGRGCCEFWLAKCMDLGIEVSVAASSSMLDTNVSEEKKLYGYHRLKDPPVVFLNKGELDVTDSSKVEKEEVMKGFSGRAEQITLGPPEPEAY